MQVMGQRFASFVSTRTFHGILLVVGSLFLLADAFHGNVWFDESYSVALAGHSFVDIWRIGASDVHPVLFYEALHVLNLVFGPQVLVYRLFAVMGAVALALLGLTHLRRDFGWRTGVLFSFFALFTPYISIMATEIRMYSWATFTVMVCAIYAYRIGSVVRKRGADGLPKANAEGRASLSGVKATRVPASWWAVFFGASLASAYLHYFGVIAAFVINLLLFGYLLVRCRTHTRMLLIFSGGAVGQVLLYAPWLVALEGQLTVVSNTYWANFVFPTTLIELVTYPVMTSPVSFALRDAYGSVAKTALEVLLILLLMVAGAMVLYLVVRAVRTALHGESTHAWRRFPAWFFTDRTLACVLGLVVYAGVFGIAFVASWLMDSLILYYRYLFVALGPLLLSLALVLARIDSRTLVGCVCIVVLGLSCINQGLVLSDDYASINDEPLVYFEDVVDSVRYESAEAVGNEVLVLSSDIGIEGVTAVTYPETPQTYLDWQPGNWGAAYEAYAPTLSSVKSWDQALDGHTGRFVVLGQTSDGTTPRAVTDLLAKQGVSCVEMQTFYRPYERTYFTIALMENG